MTGAGAAVVVMVVVVVTLSLQPNQPGVWQVTVVEVVVDVVLGVAVVVDSSRQPHLVVVR